MKAEIESIIKLVKSKPRASVYCESLLLYILCECPVSELNDSHVSIVELLRENAEAA